nr:MFS transporter [uncultured Duganella sp.]
MGKTTLDVGRAIDNGPYTWMQKVVVVMAALSIVMDGFDGQLIGFAIPSIMKEWDITRDSFAPVVAAGLVGMGIGSACAGLFADRYGRRMVVIGSVFLFGAATCAIGLASDVTGIAILRLIAGLGIGGALPSSTTMTAEFTPARRRTLAVTATIVCVPLGGMLAGLFASVVLPAYGWRALFVIGGALPLALGVLLLLALPESPRFLVRRPQQWQELGKLMARMARPVAADTVFTDIGEQNSEQRIGFPGLFAQGRMRDTLAVWCAFFMCLLTVYSAFSWLPAMLVAEGLNVAVAASGLTAYNLGGVIGALGCALAIASFGSRWPLAAGAVLCRRRRQRPAAAEPGHRAQHQPAHLRPRSARHVRQRGTVDHVRAVRLYLSDQHARHRYRLGAILSAFAGAAIITAGGATAYLTMLGLAMVGVLLALMTVRGHIPGIGAQARHGAEAA